MFETTIRIVSIAVMQIICPYCRATEEIPPGMTGKSFPCGNCGCDLKEVLAGQPTKVKADASKSNLGCTCSTIFLVALVLVGLVVLCLPTYPRAGKAARRSSCNNNLKQIGLAMHNFHDTYLHLPPAMTVDAFGNPLHSWRTLILPFLEENELYEQIRLNEPWDSPHNRQFHSQMPYAFSCPSNPKGNVTSYMVFTGNGAPWERERKIRFRDITDGTSNTIAIVEVKNSTVNWMEPRDIPWNGGMPIIGATNQPGSNHPGGLQVVMMDASTRFIADETSATTWQRMIEHQDGKPVDVPNHQH